MYPDRELIRLDAHKRVLRREIARRRIECTVAAAGVARPLEWLDRMLAWWRRLAPLVSSTAVPFGLLATGAIFPRIKILRSFVRWSPLVFGVWRSFQSTIASAGPARSRRRRRHRGRSVARSLENPGRNSI